MNGTGYCQWKTIESNTTTKRVTHLYLSIVASNEYYSHLNFSDFHIFDNFVNLHLNDNRIGGCGQTQNVGRYLSSCVLCSVSFESFATEFLSILAQLYLYL